MRPGIGLFLAQWVTPYNMWQSRVKSNIIPLSISITLPCSKLCSAELPLRAGLIRAAKMHEYLISLCSAYESRP